jgi:hypothetical protein
MTDVTVTNDPPQMNAPEARTPDGTLKDQSPNTIPTPPTPEPAGDSFLTGKPPVEPPKPEPGKEPEPAKPEVQGGAPEKYTDFKLPDGYEFDKSSLDEVTALFKGMNLSQDNAQKLVDHYVNNSMQAAQAPFEAWANLQKQWTDEIANRFPGSKGNEVKGNIAKAIDTVLPPSLARNLRTALDITGAGSHPDIVEALSILFRPHYEGTPVKGGGPSPEGQGPGNSPANKSIAERIYPHLAQNRQ